MKSAYIAAAVAVLSLAAPASAATVSILGFVKNGDTFSNVAPNAQSGNVDLNIKGSSGAFADIYAGTNLAGETAYNSIRTGGSLTYNLVGAAGDFFTFIWGTVDTYNRLTINNTSGGTETIEGQTVIDLDGLA